MRNILLYGALLVTSTILVSSSGSTLAQNRRRTSAMRPASTLLSRLPTSDVVALVKVRRVLYEALPKLFADNSAKLAEVNRQIEDFKTRTGLDPRDFDELALGMTYSYPSEGVTKINTLVLAKGNFSAGALVAAGRAAPNGKYREQKYQGRIVYIFTLDQQVRLLGLMDVTVRELAVCPLDGNTLALGDVLSVRRGVDAIKGSGRANAELIALASQDSTAVLGFGGNTTPAVLSNLRIGNDAIAKDLAAVRQVYGSLGMTDKDLQMLVAARTINADSARNLSETVEGLKAFGGLFINRLPAAKGALAKSALGNLKITTQGNELQIRTAVAQAEIAPLVGGF
ncbi:MAG: hypothetical protein ACR2G5_04040 [Pyrinomonadaceae bacterium]